MSWREAIEEAAQRHPDYRNFLRGGGDPSRALLFVVRVLKDDAADDVHRELIADCDPPALQARTARLALLMAYLVSESPVLISMTDMECASVGRARK
jgi:hypothetical protein